MGRMAEAWQEQQNSDLNDCEFNHYEEEKNVKQANIGGICEGAKGLRSGAEVEPESSL